MPDSDKITIPQSAATGKWHSKVKNPLIFQCEPLKIAVHFWPLHMGFALGPGLPLLIGGRPGNSLWLDSRRSPLLHRRLLDFT